MSSIRRTLCSRATLHAILLSSFASLCLRGGVSAQTTFPATQPAPLFKSDVDGKFDISGFLATKQGFLPIVVPITEPAVGFGLSVGLTFFHEPIRVVPGADGQPRALLPTTTMVAGGATENGTWFGAVAHLHNFNGGHTRYLGGIGYVQANLNWYGQGDSLGSNSIAYTNDMFFLIQRVTFDLGDSGFYLGPSYRFLGTNASFGPHDAESQVNLSDLQSQTSGLGLALGYDHRDHPFSPHRGIKAELSYTQQATWLGGDFDYGQLRGFMLGYIPISDSLTLGLRGEAVSSQGDVPFYDLASTTLRGIPAFRFVDNQAAVFEAELRWDISRRWTVVGFGGVQRVADDFSDLFSADSHYAGGAGFRYLIADKFGLRMGLDLAYGDDAASVYVSIGTGWVRP